MAQGDPLSTTILNVVVDAVVRHWESFMEEGAGDDRSNDDTSQPAISTNRACDYG